MMDPEPAGSCQEDRVLAELHRALVAVERKLWQLENLVLVALLAVLLVGGILLVAVVRG